MAGVRNSTERIRASTFRNAVVTDNRKHCQMRFSEAFALSEELAINRCEMQISAKFSVVWEQVQEQLEIRCSIHLSYGRQTGRL